MVEHYKRSQVVSGSRKRARLIVQIAAAFQADQQSGMRLRLFVLRTRIRQAIRHDDGNVLVTLGGGCSLHMRHVLHFAGVGPDCEPEAVLQINDRQWSRIEQVEGRGAQSVIAEEVLGCNACKGSRYYHLFGRNVWALSLS
jgi:hypothetical protein